MQKSGAPWSKLEGGGAFVLAIGCSVVAILCGVGCSSAAPQQLQKPPSPDVSRVLVVINGANEDSIKLGNYYISRRKIPAQNVVMLNCSASENISPDEYKFGIQKVVQDAIKKCPNAIDFIVLMKGVPIRMRDDGGYSVDGHLAAMNLNIEAIEKLEEAQIKRSVNPYFSANEPFSSKKYNMYLVTRLDGYDIEQCKTLVDNSLRAKAESGPFFFDAADNRKSGGYLEMQQMLYRANELLRSKGFTSNIDEKPEFVAPHDPLMGYASWGSNDGAFKGDVYRSIRFKPGAIAETYVSTSGRTFNLNTAIESKKNGGQSLIADLIQNGITGVKGYVSEPYTFALAHPDILFDRYTSGFNLAESFYAASLVTKWKDVVIGDPICRPYPQKGIAAD